MQEAPPQPPTAEEHPAPASSPDRCPSCGTPAGPGQDFCLNCGRRLSPHYRRPPSWRTTAGIAAIAVLAIGGGAGAAIGLTSGGHDKTPVQTTTTTTGAAAPPPPATTAPPTPAPGATTPGKTGTQPSTGGTAPGPTPGKPTTPAFPGAAVWPAGKTGYTVDLLETKSSKQAKSKAKAAIKKGIPAGVLQSDGYQTLPPGIYVVFAGQYRTSQQATAAANSYAKKGFGSAYARLIQPKG